MIYITGDMHRRFSRLDKFNYSEDDMLIILGDAGINYYLNSDDDRVKKILNNKNLLLFCIRGNHEERPENIKSYKEIDMFGGKVFIEEKYPNLVFAKDGEIYNIDDQNILVIGGAYSIDKKQRIRLKSQWFKDEQLSKIEMKEIYEKVKDKHFDIVLTHTCPYKYEPREAFLPFVDQSKVAKSMEHFLDKIEESIEYDKWYCGHYHLEKEIDKIEFLYKNIKEFSKNNNKVFVKNN